MEFNNWFGILMGVFIIVAVTMVLIILMQRPHGGGLAAAFGGAGAGGGDSVFGGRVGDALTWATVIAFLLFLGLGLTLNLVPVSKSDPLGACCLPDGTCEMLTDRICQQRQGTWQGADTDCATVTCPSAFEALEAAPPAPGDTAVGGADAADSATDPDAPAEGATEETEPDQTDTTEPPDGGSPE
ncbi:MAG: preprotein translocase subunit SecG [Phycisphaerales bacterium]|nr:MAG: preprotein translocase subunit SecG [Phycisphaerales bacterium]